MTQTVISLYWSLDSSGLASCHVAPPSTLYNLFTPLYCTFGCGSGTPAALASLGLLAPIGIGFGCGGVGPAGGSACGCSRWIGWVCVGPAPASGSAAAVHMSGALIGTLSVGSNSGNHGGVVQASGPGWQLLLLLALGSAAGCVWQSWILLFIAFSSPCQFPWL